MLTYELVFAEGYSVRIDIPSTYKITFGPIAGARGVEMGNGGFAFRAWESETRQRVLFTQVVSFRDISLDMRVRAVRRFGDTVWFVDDGSWNGKKADLVEHGWRPRDEVADSDPQEVPEEDDDGFGPKSLRGMRSRANRAIGVGGRS